MDLLVQVYIYGLGGSSFHLWTCWFKFSSMDLLVLLRVFFFSVAVCCLFGGTIANPTGFLLTYSRNIFRTTKIWRKQIFKWHATFIEPLKSSVWHVKCHVKNSCILILGRLSTGSHTKKWLHLLLPHPVYFLHFRILELYHRSLLYQVYA